MDMPKVWKGISEDEPGSLLWVSFAACKKYVSFYAGTDAIEAFKADLDGYVTKKNAIYFPYTSDMPLKLMERIVKWCLK